MQVGISQLIAGQMPMAEFFAAAAAAGYEAVEVAMRREGQLTPQTTAAEQARIVELAAEHGLDLVSMTHGQCTGNLLAAGEEQQRSIEQTKQGLRIAAGLGITCTLHTLGRVSPDLFYDEAYRNGIAALRNIAQTAEELGVCVAVEFVWNGFLFSPLEMCSFLDAVGSDYVGFYFDPGNMAVFQLPQHWARITGRHIKRVHLKDWQGRALNGAWTALLEGAVDFPAVMRELRAAGYAGPLISEVSPSLAALPDTAAAIRQIREM